MEAVQLETLVSSKIKMDGKKREGRGRVDVGRKNGPIRIGQAGKKAQVVSGNWESFQLSIETTKGNHR